MKFHVKSEDPILQSEVFNMSDGATVRIQIKESSYVVTINLDTDMYRNLRMSTFKKGIRIFSILKKYPRQKICKKINFTRDFKDLSQLTEDTIEIDDKYYSMKITIRFLDFIRSNVKKVCMNGLLKQK